MKFYARSKYYPGFHESSQHVLPPGNCCAKTQEHKLGVEVVGAYQHRGRLRYRHVLPANLRDSMVLGFRVMGTAPNVGQYLKKPSDSDTATLNQRQYSEEIQGDRRSPAIDCLAFFIQIITHAFIVS